MDAAAAAVAAWVDGYSGNGGVTHSGSQPASPRVAGLPSSSPPRIAVIGRQKLKWNFDSKLAITVSASEMFSSASVRAARHWSAERSRRPFCAARFHSLVATSYQNRAVSVCPALRAAARGRAERLHLVVVARIAAAADRRGRRRADLAGALQRERPQLAPAGQDHEAERRGRLIRRPGRGPPACMAS